MTYIKFLSKEESILQINSYSSVDKQFIQRGLQLRGEFLVTHNRSVFMQIKAYTHMHRNYVPLIQTQVDAHEQKFTSAWYQEFMIYKGGFIYYELLMIYGTAQR